MQHDIVLLAVISMQASQALLLGQSQCETLRLP